MSLTSSMPYDLDFGSLLSNAETQSYNATRGQEKVRVAKKKPAKLIPPQKQD